MKGFYKMKAIEILINKIDELNSKIKLENDIDSKVLLALEIKKIIEIIASMQELKNQTYLNPWLQERNRDYL